MYKVPEIVLKECSDTIIELIILLSHYDEKYTELTSVKQANNLLRLLQENYNIQ